MQSQRETYVFCQKDTSICAVISISKNVIQYFAIDTTIGEKRLIHDVLSQLKLNEVIMPQFQSLKELYPNAKEFEDNGWLVWNPNDIKLDDLPNLAHWKVMSF